jgi:predicted small integral membrane protein
MQPAREAAREAAEMAAGDVVLLPRGDDGVGIPTAFARETSGATRLLVIAAGETPVEVRARAAAFPRVAVAAIAQDRASRAAIAAMRAAFVHPCWRPLTSGRIISLYERVCGDD